mmetsp:Transcript_28934/g.90262  ORF Transcript_28934/g.90262 Transcript_28934/m.90262 type:complete len:276 (+) Transcript_28934:739-1566(+)
MGLANVASCSSMSRCRFSPHMSSMASLWRPCVSRLARSSMTSSSMLLKTSWSILLPAPPTKHRVSTSSSALTSRAAGSSGRSMSSVSSSCGRCSACWGGAEAPSTVEADGSVGEPVVSTVPEQTTPTTSSEALESNSPEAGEDCESRAPPSATLPRPPLEPSTPPDRPPRQLSSGCRDASMARSRSPMSLTSSGSPSSSVSSSGKPSRSHSMASPSRSSVDLLLGARELLTAGAEPAAATRACSFSCQWSSYVARRSMSHSFLASSSDSALVDSR